MREVAQCGRPLVEWLALGTGRLRAGTRVGKDPSRLKGSSFRTPEDDRSCGNASVV